MPQPAAVGRDERTVLFLLERATAYLAERGAASPRLDAELLLASALGVDRLALYLRFDARPPTDKVDRFRELLRRRGEGMPVAYLTGKREFWSLEFEVTTDVLIPRPETETLVETALAIWPPGSGQAGWFVDVGTGCGNLAIALAREWPLARFVAVDRSAAALGVALRNAAKHGVGERVFFLCGDWLSAFARRPLFVGMISNPPYIGAADFASLPAEVEREPRAALDGGADGLHFFRALATGASCLVREGGWLLAEVGAGQAQAVRSIWEEAGFRDIQVRRDLGGMDRVVVGRRR